MKISEHFIDSVLSKTDLVELISKKVHLRKNGANFIGLCPFHQEKTPSFTVNPAKQFFYCFGCKKNGDAISFLTALENKTFIESLTILANQLGLSISNVGAEQSYYNPLLDQIYKILEQVACLYHQNLLTAQTRVAKMAVDYLNKRGISIDIIKHHKLGVADEGWDQIYNLLVSQYGDLSLLKQTGLFVEKNDKWYDRFRGRIIFPIINKFGKIVGFGARALVERQIPKYLNSPESIVFKKNQELYGLYHAKKYIKDVNNIIVVEGYLDVLTLIQAEIHNVVATLGTAINENHLKSLLQVGSEIIFCFDGDLAGYKATVKAMMLCMDLLAQGVIKSKYILKFVKLSDNYDPDSLIKEQGPKALLNYIDTAKSLSDFFFDYLGNKYPKKNIESLNQLAQEARSYIEKFNDNLLRELWYQKLSELLGIDNQVIHQAIKPGNITGNISNKRNNAVNFARRTYPVNNTCRVIAMLIYNPKLVKFCSVLIDDRFNNLKLSDELLLMMKIINLLQKSTELLYNNDIMHYLASNLEPAHAQKLSLLDINKIVPLIINISTEQMEQEFIGAVKKINKELIEQLVDELLRAASNRTLEQQEKLLLQQMLSELYIKI